MPIAKKAAKKPSTKKPLAKRTASKPKLRKSPKSKSTKLPVKRKPNAAFMKPMSPSAALAAIVGSGSMPRTEVTSKLWAYIKKNGLQDKADGRKINADAKLRAVLVQAGEGGDDPGPRARPSQVDMFKLSKIVSKNLK